MFKLDKEKFSQKVKDSVGSSAIRESGVYKIKILNAEYAENDKVETKPKSINFRYEFDGSTGYLWNLRLQKNDGTEHFQRVLFESLLYVLGIDELSEPVQGSVQLGEGKVREFLEFKELQNKEVYVKVKREFSKWQDKITDKLIIQNFYNPETEQTAYEMLNDKEATRIDKDRDDIEPKYTNGATPEEVEQYLKAQQSQPNTKNIPEIKVADDEVPF